jgi:hypothetical protein
MREHNAGSTLGDPEVEGDLVGDLTDNVSYLAARGRRAAAVPDEPNAGLVARVAKLARRARSREHHPSSGSVR